VKVVLGHEVKERFVQASDIRPPELLPPVRFPVKGSLDLEGRGRTRTDPVDRDGQLRLAARADGDRNFDAPKVVLCRFPAPSGVLVSAEFISKPVGFVRIKHEEALGCDVVLVVVLLGFKPKSIEKSAGIRCGHEGQVQVGVASGKLCTDAVQVGVQSAVQGRKLAVPAFLGLAVAGLPTPEPNGTRHLYAPPLGHVPQHPPALEVPRDVGLCKATKEAFFTTTDPEAYGTPVAVEDDAILPGVACRSEDFRRVFASEADRVLIPINGRIDVEGHRLPRPERQRGRLAAVGIRCMLKAEHLHLQARFPLARGRAFTFMWA
jgi:hypothetical protein